jgi:hypothetical protein
MAGVHALIGVGEGLIAAVTVTAVARVRPDLVYALHGRRLEIVPAQASAEGRTRSLKPLIAVGAFVTLAIAGGMSYFASSAPDGLDSTSLKGCTVDADGNITGGTCMAQRAADHELGGSFLADYGLSGVDNTTGLAGVIGVVLTFAVGLAIFWVVRGRRSGGRLAHATHGAGDRRPESGPDPWANAGLPKRTPSDSRTESS